MKKVFIPVLAVLLVLAGVLGFFGYRKHQERFVRIGDTRYEKAVQELDLSGRMPENLDALADFTELKKLDLRGTGISAEEYRQVTQLLPGTEVLWDIPFQGAFYPMDTAELTVTALTDEDLAALDCFSQLKVLSAEKCTDYAQLHQLRNGRPDLEVTYDICLAGQWYPWDAKELTASGATGEELRQCLPYFTELKTIKLEPPMAPAEDILALREAFPEVNFSWQLELAGIPVDEFTETLDLTGIPLTVEEMDAVLPYLLSLTYVDMTDCGISNDGMDALNRRYPDTQIVWTVDIGSRIRMKTDSIWFMPRKLNAWIDTEDIYNLRYCTELICIDIGHMEVDNCDWAAFMPKLKYLIIADTGIVDISPLAGLQELVFLEMFLTDITDYSPLLECPALEDLNMYYTNGDPNVVAQMTWLKNLWWRSYQLTDADRQMLKQALPNTRMEFWSFSSTGKGWRNLQNYYNQRDILGMDYLTT